jgi:hypothetical protein
VTNVASPINVITTTDFSPSDAVSAAGDTFYIYEDTVYTLVFRLPMKALALTASISSADSAIRAG